MTNESLSTCFAEQTRRNAVECGRNETEQRRNETKRESNKNGGSVMAKRLLCCAALSLALAGTAFADPFGYRGPLGGYLGSLGEPPGMIGAPRLYDNEGRYYGRFGSQLDPDSLNNPLGRYGSPLSPDSIFNPLGAGGINRYGRRLFVVP
jgi:hypothetical protein